MSGFNPKNNKIYYIFFTILTGICFFTLFTSFHSNPSMEVFSVIANDNIIKDDLNGDGKKDSIFVKNNKEKLLVEINLNESVSHSLNYNHSLETLGEFLPYWPPRITTFDVSRDNHKEIFIQSSFHNKNIQHMFYWNGDSYKDVFCNENNILGITDMSNNRTPIIISGNLLNGKIDMKNYIFSNETLREFKTTNDNNYLGFNSISYFIDLIESFPNNNLIVPEYFHHSLSGVHIEGLYKLSHQKSSFKFQDGFFKDLSSNNKGEPHQVNWILSFRSTEILNTSITKNLVFDITLTKTNDASFKYKVTSLKYY